MQNALELHSDSRSRAQGDAYEKKETAKKLRAPEYVESSIQNSDPMMSDCTYTAHATHRVKNFIREAISCQLTK